MLITIDVNDNYTYDLNRYAYNTANGTYANLCAATSSTTSQASSRHHNGRDHRAP